MTILDRRQICLGTAAMLLAGAAQADIEIIEAGLVQSTSGETLGSVAGKTRPLTIGGKVFIDDLLRTGRAARLSVLLGGRTTLSLGERTRVKIDRFLIDQGGELTLERGGFLFDRPDNIPHKALQVDTPVGLIIARGTKFFIGPSRKVIGVFVDHGLVEVRNRAGSVLLSAGKGTDLVSPDVSPTPAAQWGAARIAEAIASVS